jgi:hypothetical protein
MSNDATAQKVALSARSTTERITNVSCEIKQFYKDLPLLCGRDKGKPKRDTTIKLENEHGK